MKRTIQHGLLAFMMAIALFLPQVGSAQAASWHSPNGWRWTINPICRNGVKVTMRFEPSTNPTATGPTATIRYLAQIAAASWAPSQPAKRTGTPTLLGLPLGKISVTGKPRTTPLQWTDDQVGTQGLAYVYGLGTIRWTTALAVGRVVVVKWDIPNSPFDYFIGRVNDCWLR